jgi:hypothetical protein
MMTRRSDARRPDRHNKTPRKDPDRTPPMPAYTGFGGNADFGADSPTAPRAPAAPASDSHGFGQYAEIGQGAEAAAAAVDPSSQATHESIRQRFAKKSSLDCFGIEVSALDGVVTLDGTIDSQTRPAKSPRAVRAGARRALGAQQSAPDSRHEAGT